MKTKITANAFPVVCLGGASSDVGTYGELLEPLPADLGIAVVIVSHLTMVADVLFEILPRFTKMPVELIKDKLLIQPNSVYIISEERDLHLINGEFRLKPISKPQGWPNVITVFLDSLSRHWNGLLIAVILSGYDGDGAAALYGIKEAGGITFAQRVDTAGQPDMPLSAIASGNVDYILPVKLIAKEIERIVRSQEPQGNSRHIDS